MADVWTLLAYWADPSLRDWARRTGHDARLAWERCPSATRLLYWADEAVERAQVVRAACSVLRFAAPGVDPALEAALADAERGDREACAAPLELPRHARDYRRRCVLEGAATVRDTVAKNRARVIHNAGMRAVQALATSDADYARADEACAAVVREVLPFACVRAPPGASLWDLLAEIDELDLPPEVAWALSFGEDLAAAWAACEEPAWLVEMAASAGVDAPVIVSAACDCADALARDVGTRPPAAARATALARAWCRGSVTDDQIAASLEAGEQALYELAESGDRTAFCVATIAKHACRACIDRSSASRAAEDAHRLEDSVLKIRSAARFCEVVRTSIPFELVERAWTASS